MDAVAFVTRHWSPEGKDAPARLAARLASEPDAPPEDRRALADLYFEEGREREARQTIARGNARTRSR